jgi:hypothetical protein
MTHEWTVPVIIATMLSGCLSDDTASTTAGALTVHSLDVAINGALLTPQTNTGQLDYGRVVTMDGSRLVTTTTSTRKVPVAVAASYTEYATIAVYDAGFAPIAVQNFGNATDPTDGSQTVLLNAVVDTANGVYYFAGKSDVIRRDLCPLDNLSAPATRVSQPYVLKYHLDAASNALVLDGCTRINFANAGGTLKGGEISGMAIGDGRLFVGGSTTATHVAIDNVPNVVAIRDGVGRNDPAMTVGSLFNADAYVASFDLNLADLQILKYGTQDWEEILDLQYDAVDNMLYAAGSTHGDMCTAYAIGPLHPTTARLSTQVCTAGFKNTSAAANRSNVRFDAYVAALGWAPGAVHPLKLKAVKQFGGDGEDTFNGLAFFRDSAGLIGGPAQLFFAGKYSPLVGGVPRGDMDARLVRMGVSGIGSNPDAIFLNATVQLHVRGVAGSTDAAGEIAVTDTAVYVAGVRNGALGTHSGPCGDGPDSQLIPRIERFDHAPTLALGAAYERVATIPRHRTGDVRGIAIDTAANRLVSYGTSNYSLVPELSSCGDPASPDFAINANNGGSDENMDQMAATFFHHAL